MKLQIPVVLSAFVATTILINLPNTVNLQRLKNFMVISEQPTRLLCRADFFSNCTKWTFTTSDGTRSALIYGEERGVNENFRIEVKNLDGRGCRLVINKTELEDAGLYECTIFHETVKAKGIPTKLAVTVTVLDRSQECTVNFEDPINEGQNVAITCSIKFKGPVAPLMQWRRNEYDGLIVTQNRGTTLTTLVNNNENVTSTLKLTASHTMHGSKYVCTTYLTETETNTTTYFHTWTSPTLSITYGPQNIQISSYRSDVESNELKICVGEMLKCSADANPSASYEWIDDTGKINITGSKLEIHQSMENMILWCRVFNSVSNRTSEKLRVVSSCTGGIQVVGIALIILAVSVIAVFVILGLILLHQRRRMDCGRLSEANDVGELPNIPEHPSAHDSTETGHESDSYISTGLPSDQGTTHDVTLHEEAHAFQAEVTDDSSEENIETSGGYCELGPRETPAPSMYIRLTKYRQNSSIHEAVDRAEYINVPNIKILSNNLEIEPNYCNINIPLGGKYHLDASVNLRVQMD